MLKLGRTLRGPGVDRGGEGLRRRGEDEDPRGQSDAVDASTVVATTNAPARLRRSTNVPSRARAGASSPRSVLLTTALLGSLSPTASAPAAHVAPLAHAREPAGGSTGAKPERRRRTCGTRRTDDALENER